MIRIAQIEENFRNNGHSTDEFEVELKVRMYYSDEEKAYRVDIESCSDIGDNVSHKIFTTDDVSKAVLEAVDSMS